MEWQRKLFPIPSVSRQNFSHRFGSCFTSGLLQFGENETADCSKAVYAKEYSGILLVTWYDSFEAVSRRNTLKKCEVQ